MSQAKPVAIVKKDDVPPVVALIRQFDKQIAQSLPKLFDSGRFTRIILNEFRRSPKLLECDPHSVLGAVINAAQLGLEIGSTLGHAYLVPYKKECQLITGYKGLADLVRRSDRIKGIWIEKVLQGDLFEHGVRNGKPILNWTPGEADRADDTLITHVFCCVEFDNGGTDWQVMSRSEVERIRSGLKYTSDVWRDHFGEMAKKTVLRRHVKTLPQSAECKQAMELENAASDGLYQNNHAKLQEIGILNMDYQIPEPPADETPLKAWDEHQKKVDKDAGKEFADAVKRCRARGANPFAMIRMTEEAAQKLEPSKLQAAADILNDWADKEEKV
jgi:recombination protein RecT